MPLTPGVDNQPPGRMILIVEKKQTRLKRALTTRPGALASGGHFLLWGRKTKKLRNTRNVR